MVNAVVFDFDYTLADSSAGILKCIHYALQQMSLPPVSEDRMRESIGLALPKTLTFLTGNEDAAAGAEFTRLFVEHADRVMADHTNLYETAAEVITTLRAAGLPLGIVSTKYRDRLTNPNLEFTLFTDRSLSFNTATRLLLLDLQALAALERA